MIIVTGATGKLGALIVESLLKQISGDRVGVSVRDPEKAVALRKRGVRVRASDFPKPETLKHALCDNRSRQAFRGGCGALRWVA